MPFYNYHNVYFMNLYTLAVKNHLNSLDKLKNLVKIDYLSWVLMIFYKMSIQQICKFVV